MNIEKIEAVIEDYTTYLWIGLSLSILLIASLGIYGLNDSARLVRAAEELHSDRVERGENMYIDQCSSCHGLDGKGGIGPALNERTLLKKTLDGIFYSVIRSGVPNTQMPAWSVDFGGPLTDEDIRDAVAYIRAWEPNAQEASPEEQAPDPSKGAVLFASTCAICHGEEGKGGQSGIPVINDPDRLEQFEDTWFRGVIANGRPAKGMPTWGTVLSPTQLDDLVALIAAWRKGEKIIPSFSETELIEQALYALSQGDVGSAYMQVERALKFVTGADVDVLQTVLTQLDAGDLLGAQVTLQASPDQKPLEDPEVGLTVYNTSCSACHGSQGEGGLGTGLQNNEFIQSQNNEDLIQFILEGRPGTAMGGFEERLSGAEIVDLIAFLRLWQK